MGKGKGRVPPKHIESRISYLHRAAVYMLKVSDSYKPKLSSPVKQRASNGMQPEASARNPVLAGRTSPQSAVGTNPAPRPHRKGRRCSLAQVDGLGQARQLVSHLKSISLKGQIRLGSDLKRSTCRRCHSLLVDGATSSHRIENKSRCGRKPWADVLVIACSTCGTKKRLPQGSKRQPKRGERNKSTDKGKKLETLDVDEDQLS